MDESFPNIQLNLHGYEKHVSWDGDKSGGYLNEFARRGITYKENFELRFSEYICSELRILKINGFVLAYIDLQILVTCQYFLKKYQCF